MRVAMVTARSRSAVSLAVPYLASDLGARNVLVVRLPDAGSSLPPIRRLIDRRIRRWSGHDAGPSTDRDMAEHGVEVVHTRTLEIAHETLNTFGPDLVVGVALGPYGGELGEGLSGESIELTYGAGREEQPEAAVLWAVHSGAPSTDLVYRRLASGHRRDVVYQEPVPIPFQASLPETVQQGARALERRAASALAEFAAWTGGLVDRAVPIDSGPSRGTPSLRDLRLIRERHAGLRREYLAGPPVTDNPPNR